MNCPGHCLLYKSEVRSYRDLPIRYSEFGTVYRNEQSGELVGLLRVRAITQDDGHAFVREDQIEEEVNALIKSALEVLSIFEMKDFKIKLSTRPDQYIGSVKLWDKATKALKNCLDKNKLDYEVKEKEGAFYGPKIDIDAKDSLGRYWQCTTIQLDFNLPRRFSLTYINKEGKPEIPVMIHRALLGSLERFIGVLLEHYQGKLPFWCSPEQIRILPISEKFLDYTRKIKEKLSNFRVEIDDSNNTLEKKIFNAINMKVPYMIILGKKEMENNTITVRDREGKQLSNITLEQFIDIIKEKAIFRK